MLALPDSSKLTCSKKCQLKCTCFGFLPFSFSLTVTLVFLAYVMPGWLPWLRLFLFYFASVVLVAVVVFGQVARAFS